MRTTYIHKEGRRIVLNTSFVVLLINLITKYAFHAGETVEIIILAQSQPSQRQEQYPLRGLPLRYDRPTDPVALDDWEAAQ